MFNKLSNGMQVDKLALVVLKLLMLKVVGFTGISKIEFSNLLELKGLRKVNKKTKTIENLLIF